MPAAVAMQPFLSKTPIITTTCRLMQSVSRLSLRWGAYFAQGTDRPPVFVRTGSGPVRRPGFGAHVTRAALHVTSRPGPPFPKEVGVDSAGCRVSAPPASVRCKPPRFSVRRSAHRPPSRKERAQVRMLGVAGLGDATSPDVSPFEQARPPAPRNPEPSEPNLLSNQPWCGWSRFCVPHGPSPGRGPPANAARCAGAYATADTSPGGFMRRPLP